MEWSHYSEVFKWDGSLRDIFVADTNVADWQALIEFLRRSSYIVEFFIDRQAVPLPDDITVVFADRTEFHELLYVYVGGVLLKCDFVWQEDIEFDLSPRDVTSEVQAEAIFEFMRQIGRLLYKPVSLTAESIHDGYWFRYLPDSDRMLYVVDNLMWVPINPHGFMYQEGESYRGAELASFAAVGRQLRLAGATPEEAVLVAKAAGLGRFGAAWMVGEAHELGLFGGMDAVDRADLLKAYSPPVNEQFAAEIRRLTELREQPVDN